MRITLVVAVDPVAIVVTGAGEADHLPRRHVAVSAIDRICEKSLPRILEDLSEEASGFAGERYLAVLDVAEDRVFLLVRERGECGAVEVLPAMPVELGEGFAIVLRGRGLRLVPC